ncbi:MAG: beta-lactamase family protein [Actinomycetota bacterium]|nr:beta-lactamase family protein [Actinomycetota bacterium]
MDALRQIGGWPAEHKAAGVATVERVLATAGEADHVFSWASVSKLLVGYATLVAAEEGTLSLDDPAGPEGSTFRHLLAHASGLGPDGELLSAPGRTRIYSNNGINVLARELGASAEMAFSDYLVEAVLLPLDLGAELHGYPAGGVIGSLNDLLRFGRELLSPTLVARETLDRATSVQFPGLKGVLPGYGRQDPNDWGIGFELKSAKSPHWTGSRNSPGTFGHFGSKPGSATFLWVDREAELACAALSDVDFGDWAREAWPMLSDAVLAEADQPPTSVV